MQGFIISSSSYDDYVSIPIIFNKYYPKITKLYVSSEYHSNNEFFEPYVSTGEINKDYIIFSSEEHYRRINENINNNSTYFVQRNVKHIKSFQYSNPPKNISLIPVILVLGIGSYSSQTSIEILLNNIFSQNNVKTYQYYSNSFFIQKNNDYQKQNLLENQNNETNPEIAVIGIELNSKEDLLTDDLYDIVRQISPDYFILCVENTKEDYLTLDNICQIRFGRNPNIITISDYFGFYSNEIEIPIYERAEKNIRIRGEFTSLRGEVLYDALQKNIFNTLTSVSSIIKVIN